ncbi:V-type ATP synthase subunit E [Parvimonas parva]|uniref:V-type proton ATPase subunit E n=1 Tax=Parvimonas parva TaxID=2769485 RepID=A0ABS1C7H0_9FIRM|nr:V-type ATP synthase subunit E [Parvimonas parva]MBK1468052.1 V-type ATP synthase subunit E [Parvimonas parva]
MSNLDNIIDEILQDAENESKKVVEDAKSEVAVLVGKTESEAQKKVDKIIEKAKVEATQSKERIISNSSLTARDMVLVAKQEMINKVFELTKEKLKTLNHDDYLKFVENSLKALEVREDSEIILTENEKKLAGEKLFGIKVADETVESGFSLKNGKIILNNEFSSLIDLVKEDLEQEVADKLFS